MGVTIHILHRMKLKKSKLPKALSDIKVSTVHSVSNCFEILFILQSTELVTVKDILLSRVSLPPPPAKKKKKPPPPTLWAKDTLLKT